MNKITKGTILTTVLQIILCSTIDTPKSFANDSSTTTPEAIKTTCTPKLAEKNNDLLSDSSSYEFSIVSSSQNLEDTISEEEKSSLKSLIGELFFLNNNVSAYYDCKTKDGMPADAKAKFSLFYCFFTENYSIYEQIKDTFVEGKGYVVPLDRINKILDKAIGSTIEKDSVIDSTFIRERNSDVFTFYGANRGEQQPVIEFTSIQDLGDNHFKIKCNAWDLLDKIDGNNIIKVPVTAEVVKGDSNIFNGYTVTKFSMDDSTSDNNNDIVDKPREESPTFDNSNIEVYVLIIMVSLFAKKLISSIFFVHEKKKDK